MIVLHSNWSVRSIAANSMILLVWLFCPQLLYALDPKLSPQQYYSRIWRIENGLPHNLVHCLEQTVDGFLWCGTENGLARFDGTHFKIFNSINTSEFRSNSIHSLLEDDQQRLWIATEQGLLRYEAGKFRVVNLEHWSSYSKIFALAKDRMGRIWIGGSAGLSCYFEDHFVNYSISDGLPDLFCRVLCTDKKQDLVWIGTAKGLVSLENGKIQAHRLQNEGSDYILSLSESPSGILWVGTRGGGLCLGKDGKFAFLESPEQLSNLSIRGIREDCDGNCWIGTNKGLLRFYEEKCTAHFPKDSPLGESILSILEDTKGNLWIGTGDGLIRLSVGRCTMVTDLEGLTDSNCWIVYENRQGIIWAGSSTGLSRYSEGQWKSVLLKNGQFLDTVQSIAEDSNGGMWFGTASGLYSYKNGHFENYKISDGFLSNIVLAILPETDGSLLLGTRGGGFGRFKDGKFQSLFKIDSQNAYDARSIIKRTNGDIWIGTNGGGILVEHQGQFTRYTTRDGLSSNIILSLYEDRQERVFVGTQSFGLCEFRQGQWNCYSVADGLLDNTIYQILEEQQYLWMSSSRGIIRLEKNSLARGSRLSALILNRQDGMKIEDCNGGSQPAGCKSQDGRLWFPTSRGLAVVNPATFSNVNVAPKVFIDQLLIDDQKLAYSDKVQIPPSGGNLEINYSCLDLEALDQVQFRYRLIGVDPDWIAAESRRVALYPNLAPGKYEFQVMARRNNGSWPDSNKNIELELEPHFYQTLWFILSTAIGLLTLIFPIHRLWTNRLRLREKYLAKCVEDRSYELHQEVERHIRTSELLVQSQKMEAVGKLAGGVAHDFNNLLTVILGYCALLKHDPNLKAEQRDLIDEVSNAGVRAEELTRQLLAFSRRQILQPKIIDLNAFVLEAKRLLERLIPENIAFRIHLEVMRCFVKIDPTQLHQVIMNLAINARDAMPQGGMLTFLTRRVQPNSIVFDFPEHLKEVQLVEIIVEDTGCGMSPEVKKQIFEPFFTTKEIGKGTGLGLSTVHGIVEQSGGAILVESEPTKGSRFKIYLPWVEATPSDEASNSEFSPSAGHKERILLVEDDVSVRKVARHILQKCGYRVLEAGDGVEALEVASECLEMIHLLITDMVMPNMGGRELVSRLIKHRPSIKVLFFIRLQ
ncbi:two-component regulator propeller domain-containing protein [Telmatocola sphagniphila]|nr:two-component regulator propeller domain-containing protein [Telmatocola sphagniphila]